MKTLFAVLPLAVFISMHGFGSARNESAWVGRQFRPEQCVKIQAGQFEVRRKLCRIRYRITRRNTLYKVDGLLEFNKKFVPTRPRRVKLELLLLDDRYVCRKQINLDKKVTASPVAFSIVTEKIADQQYIRTYTTLYYQ